MIIVGGLCFIFFVVHQGYWSRLPIMPWRLYQDRSAAILLAQGIMHDFVWQTTQYFIPIYLQTVRNYSPLRSATLILPFLTAHSLAGALSGPIMSKLARYGPVIKTGFALWALGTGLKLVFSRSTPLPVYMVVLAIEGAGVGFVHQPGKGLFSKTNRLGENLVDMKLSGLVALQALSRPEDRAVATSTRNLLRSLGGVAGVAISTAVYYEVTLSNMKSGVPSQYVKMIMDGKWHLNDPETADYEDAILNARMKGFQVVFGMLVPLMAICLASSFWVTDKQLQGDEKTGEQPTSGATESALHQPCQETRKV
jgi:hypothetical protein